MFPSHDPNIPGLQGISLVHLGSGKLPRFVAYPGDKANPSTPQLSGTETIITLSPTEGKDPCGQPLVDVETKRLLGIHYATAEAGTNVSANRAYSCFSDSFLDQMNKFLTKHLN